MAVANTYTLEKLRLAHRGQGSRLPAQQRDDRLQLAARRHRPRSGRIGTEPNQIAPGKRMLSSQTPTIVARTARSCWSPAAPAAGRSSTRCCASWSTCWTSTCRCARRWMRRLHHAWFPDRVEVEPAPARQYADALKKLREMGHISTTSRRIWETLIPSASIPAAAFIRASPTAGATARRQGIKLVIVRSPRSQQRSVFFAADCGLRLRTKLLRAFPRPG